MQKFLLLDADGVVISKSGYFSTRYEAEFGIPKEKFTPFFQDVFPQCQLGKTDLKVALLDYFALWQWGGTVDELLQYWLQGSLPEPEVMAVVRAARKKGIKCYLATDQEKYRAAYLWNDLNLSQEFDGAFFSCDLGARKEESLFWEKVLAAFQHPDPARLSFFDDEEENITAASAAGIKAHLFTNAEDLKSEIEVM